MWWAPVQRILKWALAAPSAGNEREIPAQPLPCTGRHENHICALAARKGFPEIKALTDRPAFVCANCGRVATAGANLCNPLGLDKISIGIPHLA